MKKKFFGLIPYAAVLALNYYVVPLLIRDTGSAIFVLLMGIPLITFLCAVGYGARRGFDGLLPVAAAVLFVPTLFLYYNASAWIYTVVYAAVALAGNGIGRIFYKKDRTGHSKTKGVK